MDDDRVQRFLSRQEWTSLFAPKPSAPKFFPRKRTTRHVTFEASPDSALGPVSPSEESDFLEKKQEEERKKQRYIALRVRLQQLSQPKSNASEKRGDHCDDIEVGPADYDTRLDIAKPTFLSTRPNHPTPLMRKSTVGRKVMSPNREIFFGRSEAKSETPTTQPSDKMTPQRSSSLGKNQRRQHERQGGSCSRKASMCRESGALEFMGVVMLPDIRNYTPTPVSSKKCKYSIPRSQKRFNIRKCTFHTVSQANQRFNSMFVSP